MRYNEDKPPRVQPRLPSAPRLGQIYWCDFPKDAQLPEFWKRRPVIIISRKATRFSTVNVIPCSTQAQDDNPWAFPLKTTIDDRKAWAVCDKITTVAVSRLLPDKSGVKRMPDGEFNALLKIVLDWLPKVKTDD